MSWTLFWQVFILIFWSFLWISVAIGAWRRPRTATFVKPNGEQVAKLRST